jgi:hypothetical protein
MCIKLNNWLRDENKICYKERNLIIGSLPKKYRIPLGHRDITFVL